jgi:signal recognition particle receptor subunit beta
MPVVYLTMAPLQSTFDTLTAYMPELLTVHFLVLRHLHKILHAVVTIPPSQSPPAIFVLALKCDLLKTGSTLATSLEWLAINRVRTVLERELDKRRQSHTGRVAMDELGAEGVDNIELGCLSRSCALGFSFRITIVSTVN